MAWRVGQDIWYGLAGMALYIHFHGMVYGMAWEGMRGIWYYLGRHGMVYGVAWRAWHDICYGLTGIWYGLEDMAWYMVWPGGHDMVYGMAWRVMAWLMVWPGGQWHGIWLEILFTRTGQLEGPLHACSVHMYTSGSLCAVTVNWEIVNKYYTVVG